jgi:hypothetical protein
MMLFTALKSALRKREVGDLRKEAITGDSLSIMAGRHDNLVYAEATPEFDPIVEHELREAEFMQLGGGNDAAVAA